VTQKLLFPIVLKTSEQKNARREDSGRTALYYEVAANGIFQVREARTHRAVTRTTTDLPGLLEERESIELFFPRLPRSLVENVLAFFDDVNQRWGGEAIVLLFYRAQDQHFEVGVPPQTIESYRDSYGRLVSDHHLDYGNVDRPPGCVRLGTIHSHGNLPAYASHTDCEDERYGDGLHIVFGSLGAERISSSAAFVANGRRFRLEPSDVLERAGIPARSAPDSWLSQVNFVKTSSGGGWHGTSASLYPTAVPVLETVVDTVEQMLARIGENDREH
jgi:hypothetical protein